MCDYRERFAAAGKFPGGFLKREGRPNMKETLTSRLIDRPIRPLFPEGFNDEVQCQSFVLSSDRQNDADILAMNGTAAALMISPLPFLGPIASVRVGRIDGEFVPLPTHEELEESELDLIVSGTDQAVAMIEGFARELPEDVMADAIEYAHGVIREILAMQRELVEKVASGEDRVHAAGGRWSVRPAAATVLRRVEGGQADRRQAGAGRSGPRAARTGRGRDDSGSRSRRRDLPGRVGHRLARAGSGRGPRSDPGRHAFRRTRPCDLRDIDCQVDVLPRTHGSAVFQRGETQALVTVTLGTSRDEQRVDGLVDEYSKKFMLDYNFPPFSVGECRPIRGPGRREIGHGALAERSVNPVLARPG